MRSERENLRGCGFRDGLNSRLQIFGDRRAPDANDDAVLPIVAASGLLSGLRVIMPISA
jgi:hypothetical protein